MKRDFLPEQWQSTRHGRPLGVRGRSTCCFLAEGPPLARSDLFPSACQATTRPPPPQFSVGMGKSALFTLF